jgi:hypothetical protein
MPPEERGRHWPALDERVEVSRRDRLELGV